MVRAWQDMIGDLKIIIGALLADDKVKVGVRHRLVLHHGGRDDRHREIFAESGVFILCLIFLARDTLEGRLCLSCLGLVNPVLQAFIVLDRLLPHKTVLFHALPAEIAAQRRAFLRRGKLIVLVIQARSSVDIESLGFGLDDFALSTADHPEAASASASQSGERLEFIVASAVLIFGNLEVLEQNGQEKVQQDQVQEDESRYEEE